jgi:hypothetical protein
MGAAAPYVIEKLTKDHDLSRFDCGKESLNVWLKRFAWTNAQNDSARVYVAHRRGGIIVGYHALTAGSISKTRTTHSLCASLKRAQRIRCALL